jgi:hypothetical protein
MTGIFLSRHKTYSRTCGGDSDGCFVFLLLSMPSLVTRYPLKLGTWSTLYELGYIGSSFFIRLVCAGSSIGRCNYRRSTTSNLGDWMGTTG